MMKASIEISCYPLADNEFKQEIWAFINQLRSIDGLTVVTNGMSSQVFGEYDLVCQSVFHCAKQVHQKWQKTVFVIKLIAGDLSYVEAKIDD